MKKNKFVKNNRFIIKIKYKILMFYSVSTTVNTVNHA